VIILLMVLNHKKEKDESFIVDNGYVVILID
jgi:hypothetical protein